jgi:tryptophan-rich sensory protein
MKEGLVMSGETGGKWWMLPAFIGFSLLAGVIGGFATASSVGTWYADLAKPGWNPPDAVFGPVWTALYVLMGVAAWLVWRSGGWSGARVALGLFAIQLVLNTLWSLLFFGLRSPGLALVEIVILWIAIVATLVAFARFSRTASWLMAPYLVWVTFATLLNFSIWRLNA